MSDDESDEQAADPVDGDGPPGEESETDPQDDPVAGMYGEPGSSEKPIEPGSAGSGEGEEPTADPSGESDSSGVFDAPLMGGGDDGEPELNSGTFYVKYAQDSAVTLHEVNTAQICTLIENPGFETHDIIEATLVAQPPMEVSYLLKDLESHRSIPVETSPESPTTQVMEIAAEMDRGEAVAIEREGEGEIHILTVDPEETSRTADELYDDEMTYKNAARYEVERVEIRTDESEGVVSIRYLP